MAEEYQDQLSPDEGPQSAISKTISSGVGTLAMFMGLHIAGMWAFKGAKGASFKALSSSTNPKIRAAAKSAADSGSLTDYISRVAEKGGMTARMASSIYKASTSSSAASVRSGWESAGLNTLEKFKSYGKLSSAQQSDLLISNAAKYTRDAAITFPIFYVGEHNIGMAHEGPDKTEKPAWYNLPGHAVEFAKFVPGMLALDLGFRGAAKLAGMAKGSIHKVTKPLEDAIASSPISDAAVGAADWMAKGKYREFNIAGMKLGDIIDHTGAAKDAYIHSLKSENRSKMWLRDKHVFNGYKRTSHSLSKIYSHHTSNIRTLQSKNYKDRVLKYQQRVSKHGRDSEESVKHNFGDFVKFMGDGKSTASGRTDYEEALASGIGVDKLVGPAFYKENSKTPFIARILGLRRAKGADYKEGKKMLGDIYDTLGDAPLVKKANKGKILGKSKNDFVNKVLSNNTFIHEKTGKAVNLDYFSGRHWAGKGLNAVPSVAGFSLSDLYPMKVFARKPLDRVLLARKQVALAPSQQTSEFQSKKLKKMTSTSETVQYQNVYELSSIADDGKVALATRKAGDSLHSMYDFSNEAGGWVQIGKDIRAALRSDSPKGHKVWYEHLVSATDKNIKTTGNYSDNPLARFMQEKLSLFDNKGTTPSLFRKVQAHLPTSVQNFFQVDRSIIRSGARRTLDDVRKLSGHDVKSLSTSSTAQHTMMDVIQRFRSLSSKVRKRSFDATLSDEHYFDEVVYFLRKEKLVSSSINDKKLRSTEDIFNFAKDIRNRSPLTHMSVREKASVDALLEEARLSKDVLSREIHPELPVQKLKRFIYDYAVDKEHVNYIKGDNRLTSKLIKKATNAFHNNRISKSQLTDIEFSMAGDALERDIKSTGFVREKKIQNIESEDITKVLKALGRFTSGKSTTGKGTLLDEFTFNTGRFETIWNQSVETGIEDVMATLNVTMDANPWVAYPSKVKDWAGLSGGWATATVSKLVSTFGLGWDKGRFNTPGEVIGLQAKRLGAFSASMVGLNAVDTITDASGIFDGTFLDEGLFVGIADQAVRARMIGAKAYDMLGVDNVSRYMEGLMPGSTNVLPGAAVGYALGGLGGAGIKGAAIGALANSYLGPQLQEGPLAFLGLLPPLAPFVMDMTKSYEEVQDIYEGKELLARRKGKGWTLGQTPIEGGKIEGWELHWYPKLKSQYKASPVLYGSKVEEFLAKDVPLLDFSLMDIIDPQYLTYKHYEDRPYVIPDTPFSEVPIIGPVLGSTVGRAYNLVHPLGRVDPMHTQDAASNYMQGNTTDWKGRDLGTYGPQFAGVNSLGLNTGTAGPGQSPSSDRVMSPYEVKPLISEQVYKGWIEWFGLPGFISSATLWGGDEPFSDITTLSSASSMDSFARSYWDANMGDMALSNELFRRFVPRPRTSVETVDLTRNAMPSWIPEHIRQGDPYCLLPTTLVETTEGLQEANAINQGTLVKTMYGRYYPVSNVITRPVNEKIYDIRIKGLKDFPLKVTGAHPFYIRHNDEYKWVLAKDLTKDMNITYPLMEINIDSIGDQIIDARLSKLIGLLSRWTINNKYRDEIPNEIMQDISYYLEDLNISKDSLDDLVKESQYTGIPIALTTSSLPVVLEYLEAFRVKTAVELKYRFHNKEAAYRAWTALLQNEIFGFINEDTLVLKDRFEAEVRYILGIENGNSSYGNLVCRFEHSEAPTIMALLNIDSIFLEEYNSEVYTIEVEGDETYCLPGAIVHNSKLAHGELYLPGAGYEAAFDPDITFPVGMSRLGRSAYDQALGMVGLSEITEDQEEILDKGTAIHKMVQNQLLQSGLATQIEALVASPEHNVRSFVDVMLRDPQGDQLPLEVKSINARGIAKLKQPKYEHRVQLNSYMAIMGAQKGKFLYVQRDDPSVTKEFNVRFNPDMWQQTLNKLGEARSMAQEFLSQGYGTPHAGYSYLDRMRVLLNAAPYSKEFRETETLLNHQSTSGYLSEEEQEGLSQLQGYHKAMMRRYEMQPRRFQLSELANPDSEYDNLSSNEHIKAADNYSIGERIVGSAWEYATHLRSPIHSKLIGNYSPEEQYERFALYGVPFQSWVKPYETFLKPYGRGLRSVTDPLQGAMSWGTGGALMGGVPGALAGGVVGAAYGTMHGLYRAMTGSTYKPDSFEEKTELKTYFDTIEYMRSEQMYQATGDPSYRREMIGTMRGWLKADGGQFINLPKEVAGGDYRYNPGNMYMAAKASNNPYNTYGHTNKGHQSPWGGQDMERDLRYDTNINVFSAFSALPSWDRPFWTTFLDAPEEDRERILNKVDDRMADMLKMGWGRGEEVALPDMDTYFNSYNRPSAANPIMGPDFNPDDYLTVTAEEYGLDAHDFGLGWRSQLKRIKNSPISILPVNIHGKNVSPFSANNVGQGDIEAAVTKLLNRLGYEGAQIQVNSSPSETSETIIRLNVKRDATVNVIGALNG